MKNQKCQVITINPVIAVEICFVASAKQTTCKLNVKCSFQVQPVILAKFLISVQNK